MHPFPPAADLQFLIGLEVGQVRLAPWSTHFDFADGGSIAVEGPFEHLDVDGRLHLHQSGEEQDVAPVFLRQLLRQEITELESEPTRLSLKFSNGAQLRIWSEPSQYENGQIRPPGREGVLLVF